jgi:hypothetical protein
LAGMVLLFRILLSATWWSGREGGVKLRSFVRMAISRREPSSLAKDCRPGLALASPIC